MPGHPRNARKAYLANTILTASPAQLVTLLYDALVSDLGAAAEAIERRDLEASNARLLRAQAIVLELQGSLRVDVWDGAHGLLAVYHWLYKRMVRANTTADAALCRELLELVRPLQMAWHGAVKQSAPGAERTSA